MLLVTLCHAEALRDWLSERAPWASTAADRWVALADASGASTLRADAEQLRRALYDVEEAPPAPAPAPLPAPVSRAEPVLHASTHASTRAHAGEPTPPPAHDVAPRPKRVLLVGASSMQFALGQALETLLATYQDLYVRRVGKAATGLSRPDEFNWPARLETLLEEEKPDLVVVNFGGNDAQNIPLPDRQRAVFGSDDWDRVYAERVTDFVARIRARSAQAVLIGMPIMRSKDFSAKMVRLNRVTEDATLRAGGIYLDQWDLAADSAGAYRELVEDGGKQRAMRLEDGIHYSIAGGKHVGARLVLRLERKVRLVPKDAKLGVVEEHRFHSAALGQAARYLAFLPRTAAGEQVPSLILLHGADASADHMSEQLHTELAAAVQSHRIAVVVPDGGAAGWWLDSPEQPRSRYASYVANDLVADARAHLPLAAATGIAGISMGGHGALTIALEHPGLFRSASSVSGAVDLTRAADRPPLAALLGPFDAHRDVWEAHSALHRFERDPHRARGLALRLSCGTADRWIEANRAFRDAAAAHGVALEYDEAPAGHEWSYWKATIPSHVAFHARVARESGAAAASMGK